MSLPQENEDLSQQSSDAAANDAAAAAAANAGAAGETEQDNAPPVKRGRGRPRKDASAAAGPTKETPSGTPPKRGRPPKSDKKVYSVDEIALMGKQLVGLHIMVAQISGMGELAIGDQEGFLLAQSIVNVADQYDLAIDGKTGAALQLAMTAAMIYGPRALAIRARARQPNQQSTEVQGHGG